MKRFGLLFVLMVLGSGCSTAPRIDGSTAEAFYASVPKVARSVEGTPEEKLFEQATERAMRLALEGADAKGDLTADGEISVPSESVRRQARESLHGLTAEQAIEKFAAPGPTTRPKW